MNFKAGDIVLCVKSHSSGGVIQGKEYLVDGFVCCPKCGVQSVFVIGYNCMRSNNTKCTDCNVRISTGRNCFGAELFIKPDLSSLTAILEKENVCS